MSISQDSVIKAYQQRYPNHKEVLRKYGVINRISESFLQQHQLAPAGTTRKAVPVSPITLTTKDEFSAFLKDLDTAPVRADSAGTMMSWLLDQDDPLENLQKFWASPQSYSSVTGESLSVQAEDVSLFFALLLKPFYFRVRDEFSPLIPASPFCHVCGSLPHFARLDKDEKRRFLACPICEVQWPFPRFTCPFCGTTSSEHSYFWSDSFAHLKVDLCSTCRGYIKTFVENEMATLVHPFLEDLVTPELDIAAADEGYRKVTGYFAHAHPGS